MSTFELFFQRGTLVLAGPDAGAPLAAPFRWLHGRWRCEALHYATLIDWMRKQQVANRVPRWRHLHVPLQETHIPHAYQEEALAAWQQAGRRGSIVLPTGAGKSFVAVRAIHAVNRSAVVVAPTIDLLMQWYLLLSNAFATQIGVFYGAEKRVQPITVTTYHSLGDLMEADGNAFHTIIFDEVHHLPAPSWTEGALMSPAPARLGLTATYPTQREQGEGRGRLDQLIGPLVYSQPIEALVGAYLATYRTERLHVPLTPAEQRSYERDMAHYLGFVQSRNVQRTSGPDWPRALMRLSTTDEAARSALLARQRVSRLLSGCEGKMRATDDLLGQHLGEQVLIFTEHNDVAYRLARRFLIPVITHETSAAERTQILEGFRIRRYRAIVTSRVLNEGVDVPEAKVAIILGGTAGAREYIQRLGRVLRKIENRQAVLYEVLARDTIEEDRVHWREVAGRAPKAGQEEQEGQEGQDDVDQ